MISEKAVFNRYLFTQFDLDSGALTQLGTVVHNFAEPGTYQITVLQGERMAGSVYLTVDPACPATQVNVDLAAVDGQEQSCCGDATMPLAVNPKGYAVFHVGSGAGGYAVTAGRVDREKGEKVFDSRELQAGDMFAATILRPGTYGVTNVRSRTKAQITVAYPRPSKEAFAEATPLSIECGKDGFRPANIKVEAAQSEVFRITAPARLKIDLSEADDGPRGKQPLPRPGWRKPGLKAETEPEKRPVAADSGRQARQQAGGRAKVTPAKGKAKAKAK